MASKLTENVRRESEEGLADTELLHAACTQVGSLKRFLAPFPLPLEKGKEESNREPTATVLDLHHESVTLALSLMLHHWPRWCIAGPEATLAVYRTWFLCCAACRPAVIPQSLQVLRLHAVQSSRAVQIEDTYSLGCSPECLGYPAGVSPTEDPAVVRASGSDEPEGREGAAQEAGNREAGAAAPSEGGYGSEPGARRRRGRRVPKGERPLAYPFGQHGLYGLDASCALSPRCSSSKSPQKYCSVKAAADPSACPAKLQHLTLRPV